MDTASFTGGVAFAFQGFRAFSGTGGRFIKILGGVKWLPESSIDPMLVVAAARRVENHEARAGNA